MPESLLESELFGHEKGAFTGAQYRRKGKLEMADGGTLFLDEVGTISPRTQVDLLRVLESEGVHDDSAAAKPIKVEFRVVCATNQNLEQTRRGGQVPRGPLLPAQRRDDTSFRRCASGARTSRLLAHHFLEKYSLQMNRPFAGFDPKAMDLLVRYDWPGNVRELANAVERALVVGESRRSCSVDGSAADA